MKSIKCLNKEINKEIEKYKWLESELKGQDIGWTKAEDEWLQKHFKGWANYKKRKLIEEIK